MPLITSDSKKTTDRDLTVGKALVLFGFFILVAAGILFYCNHLLHTAVRP